MYCVLCRIPPFTRAWGNGEPKAIDGWQQSTCQQILMVGRKTPNFQSKNDVACACALFQTSSHTEIVISSRITEVAGKTTCYYSKLSKVPCML